MSMKLTSPLSKNMRPPPLDKFQHKPWSGNRFQGQSSSTVWSSSGLEILRNVVGEIEYGHMFYKGSYEIIDNRSKYFYLRSQRSTWPMATVLLTKISWTSSVHT